MKFKFELNSLSGKILVQFSWIRPNVLASVIRAATDYMLAKSNFKYESNDDERFESAAVGDAMHWSWGPRVGQVGSSDVRWSLTWIRACIRRLGPS